MKKILFAFTLLSFLSGCSLFQIRHMEIEQGNVFSPEMVNELHTGMTEVDVRYVMGSPVLINTFSDNRVDYVYTLKHAGVLKAEKSVTLTFVNGRLRSISRRNT